MSEESRITIAVRDAIVKAAEAGENMSQKVVKITREAVSEAMKKIEPQKEKIEKIAGEVMDGVKAAARESRVKLLEIMEHAVDGISEGAGTANRQTQVFARQAAEKTLGVLRETGDKAGKAARDAVKGLQEGIREVKEKRKI